MNIPVQYTDKDQLYQLESYFLKITNYKATSKGQKHFNATPRLTPHILYCFQNTLLY